MEAVIFEGKEYVKASVVAEKFRYTQDYLGQLCRGKKVDARLVGRAWYLNLASLEEHRSGRHKNTSKTSEIIPKRASSNYLSRIDVEPVLKNKTVKIFKEKNGKISELSVRYEQDEYSLIPRVNKSAISTPIPILPAEAERLKIKKEAKKFNVTDFKAEALPEVFLSGAVKVDGIPEAIEMLEDGSNVSNESDVTNKTKTELISPSSPKRLVSVRQPVRRLPRGTRVDMRPIIAKSEEESHSGSTLPQKVLTQVPDSKRPVQAGSVRVHEQKKNEKMTSQKPKTAPREIKFSPDVVVQKKVTSKELSGISNLALTFVVFLLATMVSFLVLVTNREVLVERGSYVDNLSFDTSNFTSFLMPLFTN